MPSTNLYMGIARVSRFNRERVFNQLLELQFLEHGRYGQQSTVCPQISSLEVKVRRSIDFYGLPRPISEPLFDGFFCAYAGPCLSPFGCLLRIGW